MFWGRTTINPIVSLSDIDISTLKANSSFTLSSWDRVFEVQVNEVSDSTNIWRIQVNGSQGKAIFSVDDEQESRQMKDNLQTNDIYFPSFETTEALVLPLNDRRAENVLISGGKASSLASMNFLRTKLTDSLSVEIPKGIVVTSNGYQLMIDENKHIKRSIEKMNLVVRYAHYVRCLQT